MGCEMLRQENRPQHGTSPGPGCQSSHRGRQGCSVLVFQGRALVIGLSVLSLPWSCCSSLHPVMTMARLGRGAWGCFWLGCIGPGLAFTSWPWRRTGRAAHTAGSKPPSPGPAGTLLGAGSLLWGVPTCSLFHHQQGFCCDWNTLLFPAVICLWETSLGCWSSPSTTIRSGMGRNQDPCHYQEVGTP